MDNAVIVYKDRTNVITVSLGYDVSGDTLTSEIRTETGILIATWTVVFDGDGTDGELVLSLDNSAVADVAYATGLMDIKRVSGGEPYPVFDKPVGVEFRDSVTV